MIGPGGHWLHQWVNPRMCSQRRNLTGRSNHRAWYRTACIIPVLFPLFSIPSLSFPISCFLFFCLLFSFSCLLSTFLFFSEGLFSLSLSYCSLNFSLDFLSISSSSSLLSPLVSFCFSLSLSTLSFSQTQWDELYSCHYILSHHDSGTTELREHGMKPGPQINPPPKFLSRVSCCNYGKLESPYGIMQLLLLDCTWADSLSYSV